MNSTMFESVRILIVDDQRTMRAIVRDLLRKIGISSVSEAENGREALDFLESTEHAPDLVICDLHMDQMDGLEFCQKVRLSKLAKVRDTKIIVLTGDSDKLMRGISEQVGAQAVLSKPVTANELRGEIAQVVGFTL
jgi:two-component system, chemotaxis family, chemotaxis protein CheY